MFQAKSSKHGSKYAKLHVLSRGLGVAEPVLAQFARLTALHCCLMTWFV
jgi:hypothetical protein